MEVLGTLMLVSAGGVGLGAQKHSVTLADAFASCAPKPPDVQPAGEGAEGVRRPERSAAGDTEVVVAQLLGYLEHQVIPQVR